MPVHTLSPEPRLCPARQYFGFVQRVLALSLLGILWFLGSMLLLQIDFEKEAELKGTGRRVRAANMTEGLLPQVQIENLSHRIDTYCRHLEERRILQAHYESSGDGMEPSAVLAAAKREKLVRDNLVYLPELGQMWCLVPKAASTSWSKVILDNLTRRNSTLRSTSLRDTAMKSLQERLKEEYGRIGRAAYQRAVEADSVRKILLVRHPFARIVSAYRDKLGSRTARTDGRFFFQTYGALIYRKYRKDRRIRQREPTFPEFIDYLLDTDPLSYDEHWAPISLLCGLCDVRYDVVIKTEDLPDTTPFLMTHLNLSSPYFPVENSMEKASVAGFYANISRSKMVLLFKKYEMDFHLFDYNFLEYYF